MISIRLDLVGVCGLVLSFVLAQIADHVHLPESKFILDALAPIPAFIVGVRLGMKS